MKGTNNEGGGRGLALTGCRVVGDDQANNGVTVPFEGFEKRLAAEVKKSKSEQPQPKKVSPTNIYVKEVVSALRQDPRLRWAKTENGIVYWASTDLTPPTAVEKVTQSLDLVRDQIVNLVSEKERYNELMSPKSLGFKTINYLIKKIWSIDQQQNEGPLMLVMRGSTYGGAVRGRQQ